MNPPSKLFTSPYSLPAMPAGPSFLAVLLSKESKSSTPDPPHHPNELAAPKKSLRIFFFAVFARLSETQPQMYNFIMHKYIVILEYIVYTVYRLILCQDSVLSQSFGSGLMVMSMILIIIHEIGSSPLIVLEGFNRVPKHPRRAFAFVRAGSSFASHFRVDHTHLGLQWRTDFAAE
jgi:hypothetical protein